MIKKLSVLTVLFVGAAALTHAETLTGSAMALKFSSAYVCAGLDCGGAAAGNLSAVHRIDVDPAVLAQIDRNTSVAINVLGGNIPFIMSDDPHYVDGATSA